MPDNPDIGPGEAFQGVRLNAGDGPAPADHNRPGFDRICRECGATTRVAEQHGAFCDRFCRASWNNRRIQRGGQIYDLAMSLWYEPKLAKTLRLFSAMYQLAKSFRREDLEQRAGRPSWRDPRDVLAERPYLRTKVMERGAKAKAKTTIDRGAD